MLTVCPPTSTPVYAVDNESSNRIAAGEAHLFASVYRPSSRT
jgi:hypothetical protein